LHFFENFRFPYSWTLDGALGGFISASSEDLFSQFPPEGLGYER